jgi:hypothetical protein
MNSRIGDLEVIVRNPTALEAAGATIVSWPEVWIPSMGPRRGAITNGCGNGAGMEIRNRFPHRLGNLAQTARFPHSHKPLPAVLSRNGRRRTKS